MIQIDNETWGIEIEPGDIILFSRKCSSMDIISASICYSSKISTISEWDHVGLVTLNPTNNILEIVEANLGGITKRPLNKRLLRTRANKIGIRKIYGKKEKNFNEKLNKIIEEYVNKGYNSSFIDMTNAWYSSYSYMYYGCNTYNSILTSKEHDLFHLEECKKHLKKESITPLFDYLWTIRINTLKNESKELQDLYKEPCTPKYNETTNTKYNEYFCSQLISSIFTDMGLISGQRTQHTHVPSEFSSTTSSGIHLNQPYSFSPDIIFRPKDMKCITNIDNNDGKLWMVPKNSYSITSLDFIFSEGNILTIGLLPKFISLNEKDENNNIDIDNSNNEDDDDMIQNLMKISFDVNKGKFQYFSENSNNPGTILSVQTPSLITSLSSQNQHQNIGIKAVTGVDSWSQLTVKLYKNIQNLNKNQKNQIFENKLKNNTINNIHKNENIIDIQKLILNELFPNHLFKDEDVKKYVKIVEYNKDTIITKYHDSNYPILFVLKGKLEGNHEYSNSTGYITAKANSGDIINAEGLVGSPCLIEWKVNSEKVNLISIDRNLLTENGLIPSSWLWHNIVDSFILPNTFNKEIKIPSSFEINEENEENKTLLLPQSSLSLLSSNSLMNLVNVLLREKFEILFTRKNSTFPILSSMNDNFLERLNNENKLNHQIIATSNSFVVRHSFGIGKVIKQDYLNKLFHLSKLSNIYFNYKNIQFKTINFDKTNELQQYSFIVPFQKFVIDCSFWLLYYRRGK